MFHHIRNWSGGFHYEGNKLGTQETYQMFTPPLKYSLMTSSKQTQAQTIFEPEESLNICHNIGIFSPKKLTKLLSNAFSFSNSVFFYIISVCFEDIHYLGQQTVSIFVRCFIKWSIAFPKLSHKEYFFLVSSTFRFFFFFLMICISIRRVQKNIEQLKSLNKCTL